MPKTPIRDAQAGQAPNPVRGQDPNPVRGQPPTPQLAPAIEVTAKGDDHNTTVIRDRAINLRDNLVRVCDGERLDRSRDLLNRAVAVALGKG